MIALWQFVIYNVSKKANSLKNYLIELSAVYVNHFY